MASKLRALFFPILITLILLEIACHFVLSRSLLLQDMPTYSLKNARSNFWVETNPNFGVLSYLVSLLGVHDFKWASSPGSAMFTVVLVDNGGNRLDTMTVSEGGTPTPTGCLSVGGTTPETGILAHGRATVFDARR